MRRTANHEATFSNQWLIQSALDAKISQLEQRRKYAERDQSEGYQITIENINKLIARYIDAKLSVEININD